MEEPEPYPIGEPGRPWGEAERALWRERQVVQRRYADDVLARVTALAAPGERFDVVAYGELDEGPGERYPLVALRSRDWAEGRPTALVTGGVHGYETSGVTGALGFAEQAAGSSDGRVNLLVVPCVSPWAYERCQRWTAHAVDPNRSFVPDGPATESAALLRFVAPLRDAVLVHVDLHETTDTDASEFGPARAAAAGLPPERHVIPDGFYLVNVRDNPQPEFHAAIIAAVERVTHIAPADPDGTIIGCPVVAPGVIEFDTRGLGLCAGMTSARFATTTEVYPDSPRTDPRECEHAQIAAVCAALDYALAAAG